MTAQALLETHDLHKSYGGVHALRGASVKLFAGEVHALLGENGAGKSTLMGILAGVQRPDTGRLELGGEEVLFHSAAEARAAGVGIVFQELSLFPDLDVLANLFVGREPTQFARVNRASMRSQALPIMMRLGLTFPLDTKVASLTLAERQLVEIAKALQSHARLLILDEPNSALNSSESARLFSLVEELRNDNCAVVYISHRLEEVFSIADRISVMRGGRVVLTDEARNLDIASAVTAMLGRPATTSRVVTGAVRRQELVTVRLTDVIVPAALHGVSFDAHHGEVVGLVGLEGAGHQEVLRALFGDVSLSGGHMELANKTWSPQSPRDAVRAGVGFVPADRTRSGLMMDRSIGDNIAQVRLALTGSRVLRNSDVRHRAKARITALGIKADSSEQPASSLSGGNQQKVVLAKWLEVAPKLLLLDDPTRGVDVGGKSDIYALVTDLAAAGTTVLFTSSEFAEYQLVCQRVLIFFGGRLVGEVDVADATEHVLAEMVNTGRPSDTPSSPPNNRPSLNNASTD